MPDPAAFPRRLASMMERGLVASASVPNAGTPPVPDAGTAAGHDAGDRANPAGSP